LLLRLATAAGAFWSLRSNVEQRRRWLGTALQQAPEARPSLRLKALVELGELLRLHGDAAEARPILQEALALARLLDDARSAAQSLIYLSWCTARAGALDEALAQIDAGSAVARAAGDGWLVALAEMHRWGVARLQGQTRRSLPWLEGAVRGFRTCGDAVHAAVALSILGTATGEAGDYLRAVACYRECLEISIQLEDPSLLNHAGDAITLLSGGAVVADEVLAELMGALEALVRTRGLGGTPEQPRRERLEAELQVRMGAERFTAAREWGRARSYGELVTLIRQMLDGLVAASIGQPPVAANTADPLSSREHEVLHMLAAGLSNRAIAAQLSVAERTAKHHLTGLFNKLGASSRTQALAVARERDLL
jgi:non-specific serine/threonine protein kinase